MSAAATNAIHLPRSLEKEALRLAGEDGVTLDHWVSLAVAQKIGSVETAAEFFRKRARDVSSDRMLEILSKAGNEPPLPGDELPDDLRDKFAKHS